MGSFWRDFLDFFLPPKCPLCGTVSSSHPHGRPCPACLLRIPFIGHPRCPRCGRGYSTEAGEDHLCGTCLTEGRTFYRARSIGAYEGLLLETIARFKFRGVSYLANPLGALLAEFEDPEFPFGEFELLLPVPLHPQRLRFRGYNQSLLLARRISRHRSIPLNFTALVRTRPTQPQTQLSGPERQKNIRGAFAVRNPAAVQGKKVLLIDDVFTTGATVQECARVLLRAGADRVDVLTVARVL